MKKGYLIFGGIIIILIIIVLFSLRPSEDTSNVSSDCRGSGKLLHFMDNESRKECCEGLTLISITRSESVCEKCGDGICSMFEKIAYPEDEFYCDLDCSSFDKTTFIHEKGCSETGNIIAFTPLTIGRAVEFAKKAVGEKDYENFNPGFGTQVINEVFEDGIWRVNFQCKGQDTIDFPCGGEIIINEKNETYCSEIIL